MLAFNNLLRQNADMAKLLLLNGPNLNLLGSREPNLYGQQTLTQIVGDLTEQARAMGHELTAFQSNAEHELVEKIQQSTEFDLILFNPAALTHTSIAIRDALLAVGAKVIELHLSNPATREPFRHHSYISDIALGTISGFGAQSYELALLAADQFLT